MVRKLTSYNSQLEERSSIQRARNQRRTIVTIKLLYFTMSSRFICFCPFLPEIQGTINEEIVRQKEHYSQQKYLQCHSCKFTRQKIS